MNRSSMHIVSLLVVLLSSWLLALPAYANVNLSYFEIDQGSSSNQLVVLWGTETETDTAAFIIRRGVTSDQAQGADIATIQATGTAVGGDEYEYVDNGVTEGQTYYYWLIEFTRGGERQQLGEVQQVTAGSTATPTTPPSAPTTPPTATLPAPTATTPPTATQPAQSAAQGNPQPTATPQPLVQNTPAAANTAALVPTSAQVNPPAAAPTSAPVNPAVTDPATTPALTDVQDAEAKEATAVAAVEAERSEGQTNALEDASTTTTAAESENAAAAEQASGEATPTATATPQTVAQVAPAQDAAAQAQLVRPTATPRPSDSSGENSGASSLLLVIGGGSVCGAALLALVVFFVWRRR